MESLFRCPLCAAALTREEKRYTCPTGHSFDRAAAGYVHLLPANKMHSKDPGDDKGMATARNRFLSGDYYTPLRDTLAEQYLGEQTERKETMNLYMEETLKHQLSREMILESDMAEVIAWCESTGRKVKNSSGHFIGHKKIQNMTYWAEYQPEGDGYRLFTGYAHRMCLEEENK